MGRGCLNSASNNPNPSYYLGNGYGAPVSNIYFWSDCRLNPNTRSAQQDAENTFLFSFPKDLYKYYKSATIHNHKLKIPKKVIFWTLFPLIAALACYQLFSHSTMLQRGIEGLKNGGKLSPEQEKEMNLNSTSTGQSSSTSQTESKSREDKPLTASDFQSATPLAPWSAPIYRTSMHIESIPHFSGCISTPKKCSCYTQQGTSLDVDKQTCMAVIEKNDMPFNPFKKDSEEPPFKPEIQTETEQLKAKPIVIGLQDQKQLDESNRQRDDQWANASAALTSQSSSASRRPM